MSVPPAVAVIEAEDLVKEYPPARRGLRLRRGEPLRAVDGVSLTLRQGRTLALVGESGSGKSTTARMILLLERPTAGRLRFDGEDMLAAGGVALRRYRASVQAVFQDPWSSLNPRMSVGWIVREPLVLNTRLSAREVDERVAGALAEVGLEAGAARRFPHAFSGGQRQRIAIARAIILRPRVVVLDEPVSALDVSVRLQIVNLLADIQQRLGMSYMLISHDLASVRYQADDIAVTYRGRIVERGDAETVFATPRHPYTRALLDAARFVPPGAVATGADREGEEESAVPERRPIGCAFAGRCPHVAAVCRDVPPELTDVVPERHAVACHVRP